MDSIYKFPLRITDVQTVKLPAESQILSVKLLPYSEVFMWAIVDTETKYVENREIHIVGTGHSIDSEGMDGFQFIGTVVDEREQGMLIWHIFAGEPTREHILEP